METIQFAMVEELAHLVKDNLFSKHLVLSTEETLVDFLQNNTSPDGVLELEPMNAYNRLLLHRLADIFGFFHESIGEGDDRHLVLERCPESSIPSILVSDILSQYDECEPTTSTHILRKKERPQDMKGSGMLFAPSVTVEEREAAYLAARERIFALNNDDEKEPADLKPRNIPVVARRMIAHALGQRITSQNVSQQNSEKDGLAEDLSAAVEKSCLRSTEKANKDSLPLAVKKRQTHEKRVPYKFEGKNISSRGSCTEEKLNGMESLNAPSNKPLPSEGHGRVDGATRNLERERVGAAKRLFAHALGLPSGKGLRCNEDNQV